MNGLGAHEPTHTHAKQPPCFKVSLHRGGHRWNFSWDPGDEGAIIDAITQLAADQNSAFDWFDAAILCRQIVADRALS